MPNPHGNPEIKKYGFKTDRNEPLTEQLNLRVTKSMMEKLKTIDNYRDKCRQAIAAMLDEIEQQNEQQNS